MPVVKNYERSVQQEGIPGGLRQTALTEEAAGGSIGAGIRGFGLKMYEDEMVRQDQVAIMEADRKLGEWENKTLYDPKTGALSKRGKDAFGVPDQVDADLTKQSDEIFKGLSTDRQRVAFERAVAARRSDLQKTLSRHVFTEARQYENQETENYLKNKQQSAILNFDNQERIALELDQGKGAILDFARRNGLGAEYQKQKIAQFESDTHVAIIGRFLANGQDQSAQKYLEMAKKNNLIAGDDLEKVESKLKTAVTEGQGLRGAADIWDAMGPKTDTDPVNSDQMIREAEKKYADNPSVLKAVKQGIVERASLHNASQRERAESAANDVWKVVEQGGSFAAVRKMPQFMALPGKQQNEIKTWMIDRADTLKRRAEGEGDDALYYNLITEASSGATADKFATTNLLEYRTKLSKSQFQTLVGVQAAIRKGDDKESAKLLASERQQAQMVNEALLAMKLDPTPNEKTSPGKVEQINGFRRAVREAVAAHEARTGKKIENKEMQGIVDGLIIEGVTKANTIWFNERKRVYQLQPGETIAIKVTDVPKVERSKIEEALRNAKQPVTDEAVTSLYRAKLNSLRGAPAVEAGSGRIK